MTRCRLFALTLSMGVASLVLSSAASAQFRYEPAGRLVSGSGTGRADTNVYAPGMRFPLEAGPAYANSQVWGHGGYSGPGGGQCDGENYSFPWRDNYCETRGHAMPMCPAGVGHQGQDIRPATCADRAHWAVAAAAGTVTHIGSYSVYVTDSAGVRYDYLHMRDVAVRVGQSVTRGQRLGKVSNNMGATPTTIHLHFNLRMRVSGYSGTPFVSPYMSLVRAYEGLSGETAPDPGGGPSGGCDSALLGRRVGEGECVQAQRDRAVCGASGCAWFQCSGGAWVCADTGTCAERHANAECPAEPIPAENAGCHSSLLGRHVSHGTCVQTQADRPECGVAGCAWFRCDSGAWMCSAPTECAGESHANAGCGGGGTPTPPPAGSGWLRSPLGSSLRVTSHVSHRSGGRNVNFACDSITRSGHKGTDFGTGTGTPVHAASAGRVIRSVDGCSNSGYVGNRCGGGFGNHVIVAHPNGHATLYAHLTPRSGLPAVGTEVGCGDRLGLSGNSGSSSGPHLHFEVRRGTDVSSYYASGPLDPYGGACSSQSEHLWIGGRAGDACTVPSGPRDDATFASATHEGPRPSTPGERVEQLITMRNTGTTTWTPDAYVFAHAGGAFGEVAEVPLPEGSSIEPGQTIALRVTVTAPEAPGEHRGAWRMKRRTGDAFGQEGALILTIAASPGSCDSYTLGRQVDEGECVQVAYAGCGMSQCGWYRCGGGTWQCVDPSACGAEAYAHESCGGPPDCGSITDCGACADVPGCSFCRESGTCVADGDRAACTSRVTDPGQCDACKTEGQVCAVDQDCCGATDGGSVQCLLGFCTNTAGCGMNGDGCTNPGECCGAVHCSRATFGGSAECCNRHDDPCASSDECCGEQQCRDGRCVCREVGEPCAGHIDCCGGAFCEEGTCTFGS